MFLFHVCKIGGNLDRKLFLQNWRALMLTSCAYRLSFICEVLAYNNTLYVCHHCVVIQCSAVFTVTLVTLQNMLAFQFKFYSYYLGFCFTPKFCQWIWRIPTDCAVVALLAKYRGSHILPCVCHLVQKKGESASFLPVLWVLSIFLAFLSLSSVHSCSFCSLAPRTSSKLHLLMIRYDTCVYSENEARGCKMEQ